MVFPEIPLGTRRAGPFRFSLMSTSRPAVLALEDGSVFRGLAFGADATIAGECVFNTSMTGYQEILTDPSYFGQIVTMTAVQIGNYGVNEEDTEASVPKASGFVVRELSPIVSNWRSTTSLGDYLRQHGIPGIKYFDQNSRIKPPVTLDELKSRLSEAEETLPKLKGFNFNTDNHEKLIDSLRNQIANYKTIYPDRTRNFVIFPGSEKHLKIIKREAKGGMIHKADGGQIQGNPMPTLAQMKFALSNPSNQIIGANEAPDMSPKVYFPPVRSTSSRPHARSWHHAKRRCIP